jgi:hypothetical protein
MCVTLWGWICSYAGGVHAVPVIWHHLCVRIHYRRLVVYRHLEIPPRLFLTNWIVTTRINQSLDKVYPINTFRSDAFYYRMGNPGLILTPFLLFKCGVADFLAVGRKLTGLCHLYESFSFTRSGSPASIL